MNTITIPKNLIKNDDLIIIPRQKYEKLLDLEKIIKIVKPIKSELQAIKQGRKEIKKEIYFLV